MYFSYLILYWEIIFGQFDIFIGLNIKGRIPLPKVQSARGLRCWQYTVLISTSEYEFKDNANYTIGRPNGQI